MNRNKFVKAVAIFLAVIMLLSTASVLLQILM
jgi:hypothetical protein